MVQPSRGIVPGSTEYGERQALADAVDSAGSEPTGPAAPGATTGAAGLGGPLDPLASMMQGKVSKGTDPITSGLSVGPGDTPIQEQKDPVKDRLIYVATNAKNPKLRIQAREALRVLTVKNRGG